MAAERTKTDMCMKRAAWTNRSLTAEGGNAPNNAKIITATKKKPATIAAADPIASAKMNSV